jgi:phosphatidate cytidylyltransferase
MEPDPNSVPSERWGGLKTRIVSALVLACVALACIWLGGVVFICLVLLAVIILKKEYDALVSTQSLIMRFAGYPYILLPCACLIWLRGQSIASEPQLGYWLVIALVAVIAATDIGAYFTGKRFGSHKLAPVLSPGKTWEGLCGGIVAAMLTGMFLSPSVHLQHSWTSTVLVSLCTAVIAQGGDLFESALKRKAGVKDSGALLPGHGGLLDRVDGYMFAAPFYALLVHFALQLQPPV